MTQESAVWIPTVVAMSFGIMLTFHLFWAQWECPKVAGLKELGSVLGSDVSHPGEAHWDPAFLLLSHRGKSSGCQCACLGFGFRTVLPISWTSFIRPGLLVYWSPWGRPYRVQNKSKVSLQKLSCQKPCWDQIRLGHRVWYYFVAIAWSCKTDLEITNTRNNLSLKNTQQKLKIKI